MMLPTIVVVIAAAAFVSLAIPSRASVHRVAIGAAFCALVLSIAAALQLARTGALAELSPDLGVLGDAPLFSLDGLSAPWVVASVVVTLAILIASPRLLLPRENVIAVLATSAATVGVLASRNVGLTTLFWTLALVPAAVLIARHPSAGSHARTYAVLALGGSLPMIAAAVLIGHAGWAHGLAAPLDLEALAAAHLPRSAQTLPFVLLLAAVSVRMGLFPFHSWLPPMMERGPIGVVTLLVGIHTGLFVVAKVGILALPDASATAMPWVADFALVAALWGSALALVQTDLARTLGFLSGSKAGMVLMGLASLEPTSVHGSLLQSLGHGIALTGVLLIVRGVDARYGTRDVRHLGGLVSQAPRTAGVFLVLGAATVGFPGSVAFVGEDLLVHGVLDARPIAATILLLATALNGITMFRAFTRTFLGRPTAHFRAAAVPPVDDLLPRERWVSAALLALLIGFGLAPGALLAARGPHVEEITRAVMVHHHDREPPRSSNRLVDGLAR